MEDSSLFVFGYNYIFNLITWNNKKLLCSSEKMIFWFTDNLCTVTWVEYLILINLINLDYESESVW